jgi:hypothetical protein
LARFIVADDADARATPAVTIQHADPANIIETAQFARREPQNPQIQRLINHNLTIRLSRAKLRARVDREQLDPVME